MLEQIAQRLTEADTADERENFVLQVRLASLSSPVRVALKAAAIPHWFDLPFLATLLDEPPEACSATFESLTCLSMVEPCPERGYNVHERSRYLLLEFLAKEDPGLFIEISRRAALYCRRQAAGDAIWEFERIFHLLISEPAQGLDTFRKAAQRWDRGADRSFELLEALARTVREQREAGRLDLRACGWSFYWDGRLARFYSPTEAKDYLLQARALAGQDAQLGAETALALGSFASPDEARSLYQESLMNFQRLDDKLGVANAHLALGSLADKTAGLKAARPHYEKALVIYEQIGDREGREDSLRRLDRLETSEPPVQLFLSNLPTIEAIASHLCRRHGLSREETQDFISLLKVKFIEDDYAIIRKFKGGPSFRMYLSVIIAHLFRDSLAHSWGKWRPSAEASRLGPIAIQMEKLSHRDGFTFDEAIEILMARHGETLSREELASIRDRLPWRSPRRRMVAEEQLEKFSRQDSAPDQRLLQKERQEHRERTLAALRNALDGLPPEDQLLLKMSTEFKISEIARRLGRDQKPLYRRIESIMKSSDFVWKC